MRLLLSNDDGIGSPFLPIFAEELAKVAEVEIVVPAKEQSWVGRSYNRHGNLIVEERDFQGLKCRTITGTPSDCVNIALSHLYIDNLPDAVISGLNIGQNIAFPLLWSSGTFSAAVEAAGRGLPAFACSMRLEKKFYEKCRLQHEPAPEELCKYLRAASEHTARYIVDTLSKGVEKYEVHNLNYPVNYLIDTPFRECVPARAELGSLYKKNDDDTFEFSYSMGKVLSSGSSLPTDLECLTANEACVSRVKVM